ncbi:MAG TPA: alkaline phosphatase D family protein [Chitinophaga sp.]|uniref:alkaline phosphatase D family protein n=1 Tax=Chitinophaga sp. TaxID=1869181 RepID=UPI002BA705C9|nr:alkaline phosphatase D family protein [Chitinophaga sp.]HVI45067.1 alkaline phosphatase D family protein [Chitinophaga sp.]
MKNPNQPRRKFLRDSFLLASGIFLAPNFISCKKDPLVYGALETDGFHIAQFDHGVASFDPTSSQIIIWTRYSTTRPSDLIKWQLAFDAQFNNIVRQGEVSTDASRDYTVAIEVQDLPAGKKFYYRFLHSGDMNMSETGETITIATDPSQLKLAVCSCAHYAAGLFNVYSAMAASDADIIIHLGDYIYEYGNGEYGTNDQTITLGRTLAPAHELLTLEDYRTRYRQYRTDKKLQLAHRLKPFICIWDDHEVANDAYTDGAQNHNPGEGSYQVRKQAALQAYNEYLPFMSNDSLKIYRNFSYGSLLNLNMLDTRIIGRQKQLKYGDFMYTPAGSTTEELNTPAFLTAWQDASRTILGATQRDWVVSRVNASTARWQVLAQQVIMAKMVIPEGMMKILIPILTAVDKGEIKSIPAKDLAAAREKLPKMAAVAARRQSNPATESAADVLLPYNLDAWDGYPAERDYLFNAFNKKVVVLSGDSHNAWYNLLKDKNGTEKGKELAASSVTSPGFESYLKFIFESCPALLGTFETLVKDLIPDVSYLNASQRGFVKVTFTQASVNSEWIFVNAVFSDAYSTVTGKTVNLT